MKRLYPRHMAEIPISTLLHEFMKKNHREREYQEVTATEIFPQLLPILLIGDQIAWVVGIRADHRFRITTQTQHYYKISYLVKTIPAILGNVNVKLNAERIEKRK